MMSVNLTDAINEYTQLSLINVPESARIVNSAGEGRYALDTYWSQKDLVREENISLRSTIVVNADTLQVEFSSPFVAEEARLWDVLSPSGTLRAVCLKKENKTVTPSTNNYFIQIWRHHQLVKTIDVSALDKHGDIYKNDKYLLSTFVWSYNEGHVLYTAEAKKPKSNSYFKSKLKEAEGDNSEPGHQYDYEESWGEQLTYAKHSVLCVLDVESGSISMLDNVPPGISPGHAVWCPDDTGVLFVGYPEEPFKLGLIYCSQRESAIYYIDFSSAICKIIGHDKRAVSSPRFSPNGRYVVWLEQESGGAHQHCRRLICCCWKTKEIRTVIDVVEKAGDGFPGINSLFLPIRCWCADNQRILLHSLWRSRVEIFLIDTISKLGRMLSTGLTIGTGMVLDIEDDIVVAKLSSPSRPHFLALAKIPEMGQEDSVEWKYLDIGNSSLLTDIAWTIQHHVPDVLHPDYGAQEFESIIVGPSEASSSMSKPDSGFPLVVFPHGGPHSVFSAEFSPYVAGLVMCGFVVLQVNYRGSLGFGEDFIRALLGNVGKLDVADCYQVTKEAISSGSSDEGLFVINPEKVCVMGGSHGGFLSAHLSARYPELYKVAVCRNPVINIATMSGATDISDWCFVESGLSFNYRSQLDSHSLATMLEASPMHYIQNAKTPTLLVIGEKDARVPPSQSREWYHALKARGVPVRMLVYPDDAHPIISIKAESDCFVNIVQWFRTWMS